MGNEIPKRLAEARRTSKRLSRELTQAYTVLPCADHETTTELRADCDSVVINVWSNAEGRQCLEITSNRELTVLETKGLIHDALYALAHADDSAGVTSS